MAKRTAAEIMEQTRKILEALEKEKARSKDQHRVHVTAADIEKKLKRANSPMFAGHGWSGASPGGLMLYNVQIWNPDPVEVFFLFVHVWVGSGHADPVIGTFLSNVDTRFPRLTEPVFGGLKLKPSTMATLNFSMAVPAGVPKTNYIGNACLMQLNGLDVGNYLDRSGFVFPVQ